jgi:hypothetical protein
MDLKDRDSREANLSTTCLVVNGSPASCASWSSTSTSSASTYCLYTSLHRTASRLRTTLGTCMNKFSMWCFSPAICATLESQQWGHSHSAVAEHASLFDEGGEYRHDCELTHPNRDWNDHKDQRCAKNRGIYSGELRNKLCHKAMSPAQTLTA